MAESPPHPVVKKTKNETLIPEKIIHRKILPRLPSKSALICQVVSKTWRDFINLPLFTRLHHSHAITRNPATFLIRSFRNIYLLGHYLCCRQVDIHQVQVDMLSADRNTNMIEPIHIDYAYLEEVIKDVKMDRRYSYVVGICVGVVCLAFRHFVLLWNPAIREVLVVKYSFNQFHPSKFYGTEELKMTCIGFGGDKDGDDNVVNIKLLTVAPGDMFSVYSLKTNKWNLVESPSFQVDSIKECHNFVCFDGVLYWLVWGSDTTRSVFVLTFNIVSETFGRIEFPNEMIIIRGRDNFLTLFEGRYLTLTVAAEDAEGTVVNNWIFNVDGNKKQWVRVEKKIRPLGTGGTVLGSWADGNALIVQNHKTLCFHFEGKCSAYEPRFSEPMKCWEYAESFVSPIQISDQANS